ncbi:ectoine/hydroxyectoine ABC transporter substrate-binding protein EhuB [Gluconacetobacter azotocaptans]|uniref:Ectoine/hydroxyectoine ABC transporter substrate-binding protein EhuB n=1 Tax=Gluconacetobacter azotocaptans TaxID=142834 RepID=A0A7W4JQG7_9PROT|nr:ectoine/hydroxyectoine ABC transporter substrate-binding protein EhuB [Gluconacetobacter azotocaptans]MBB2188917.1 ectoine/hydroxyectoine ABC transporter substrate-binding protein EhuB [Gluconacetobacter azotocaptans]
MPRLNRERPHRALLAGLALATLIVGAPAARADDVGSMAGSPSGSQSGRGLTTLRQRGFARLAMSNEPPWAVIRADGSIGGAGPDLVRAVFRRMGIDDVRGVVSSYGAMIPGLMAGRSDLIDSGMFMTPGRCMAVAYSQPDLCDREALIMQHKGRPGPRSYRDVAADPNLLIGVPAGGSEERLALTAGVPPARIVPVPDGPSGMIMLETGRIQIYSLPAMSGRHLLDLWGTRRFDLIPADGTPVMCAGAAFSRDATDLRDAYDRALAALQANGDYARLLTRYGFDPALSLHRTRADLCAAPQPTAGPRP